MTLWTAPPDDRRYAVDHHSRDAAGRRLAGGAGDKAVSGWQPIETAPSDGTAFLAFWPQAYQGKGGMYVMLWHDDGFYTNTAAYELKPTHWMPLPEPPK